MTSILVVEDNPLKMELVFYLLKSNGMEVILAFDGLEVIKNIKTNTALAHIPVAALTAHAMQGDEQKLIDAGCRGYISKPIDVPNFQGEVHSIFSKGV